MSINRDIIYMQKFITRKVDFEDYYGNPKEEKVDPIYIGILIHIYTVSRYYSFGT